MQNPFRELDPDPKHERKYDELEAFCYNNWMLLPEDTRRSIVDHIKGKASVAMLNQWREQYSRGVVIGSDDPWFHMGIGMQIRNACRDILLDTDLPFVKYDDGGEYQNWDDFYSGMLQQLVREINEQ